MNKRKSCWRVCREGVAPLVALALLVVGGCYNCISLASEITFKRLEVTQLPGSPTMFVGKVGHIEVRFVDASAKKDTDDFTDPPITISNRANHAQCVIDDGGVWARREIYLSGDERFLLLAEHDGSQADLVSYDTSTCRAVKRLDVSVDRWEINGRKARIGTECDDDDVDSCRSIQPMDLRVFVNP